MKYQNTELKRTSAMKLERKITKLVKKAQKDGVTLTYEEVGTALGRIPRHKTIARALANLVWEDVRRGRPIRTSIIVRKDSKEKSGKKSGGTPGEGFFTFLEEVGFAVPKDRDARVRFAEDRKEELFTQHMSEFQRELRKV